MNRAGDSQAGYAIRPDGRTWFEGSTPPGLRQYALWYRSRAAWRFVLARFTPLLAAGNLIWETLQLPLYTLWQEGTPKSLTFAVVHCTLGDVLIGTAVLLLAVIFFGDRNWPYQRHGVVLGATMAAGLAYTIFSEWLNTEVTMGWQYAESMIRVPPLGTGIAPLLQWLVVPALAYLAALRLVRPWGPAIGTANRGPG